MCPLCSGIYFSVYLVSPQRLKKIQANSFCQFNFRKIWSKTFKKTRARALAHCICYPYLLAKVSRGSAYDQKCDFPVYFAKKQAKPLDFNGLRIFQSLFFIKLFVFSPRARALAHCICYPYLLAIVSRGSAYDQKCDFPVYFAKKQAKPLDFNGLRIFQSLFFIKLFVFSPRARTCTLYMLSIFACDGVVRGGN